MIPSQSFTCYSEVSQRLHFQYSSFESSSSSLHNGHLFLLLNKASFNNTHHHQALISSPLHSSKQKNPLNQFICSITTRNRRALMASNTTEQAKVQHVNRASSDELLRKFAEMESAADDDDSSRKINEDPKRRKRSRTNQDNTNHEKDTNKGLVERRSLLPTVNRRSSALLREFGIGRSSQLIRAREMKNRSFLGAIEKTWRKTVEGASKVFIERHYIYNRHRRLINDVV